MNSEQKLKLFVQVKLDLTLALRWADEVAHGGHMSPEQASELNRRCIKVSASALAFERAMAGAEPPRRGD